MPDANLDLMTVFAEALERTDPAARAAYLDRACEADAALRQRVEALLAAHERAGRFLEPDSSAMSETAAPETEGAPRASVPETGPSSQFVSDEQRPDDVTTTIAEPAPLDRSLGFVEGQVIAGRYTLHEILGEGGMGTVYRAEQIQPVKRQVALKVIKIGMDSRAVLARFDAERQALALMDHPNIARIYDGGTTAAGQPFFVMELVSGVPITEYCDRERLRVGARLELFVAVCQAVQHAHQKGIIHRDLKPGNVLVTEADGRLNPKVIDFGVAKATEFKLTDQSLADSGAIVGTPAYMSPEQADPSSMDIDTRTDVYALGVILYELLAGSPPIDAKQFQRGAFLEMLRMVREVEPPRPSTRVSTAEALPNIAANRNIEPEQLKRALKGDLDWIVMKALEKDRARRYETANGFADDVLRHLAHEPVQAAPPSRAYRLRKFVRKHRRAVVAASLVFLALVGGIAGTTWGLFREAERVKERDAAVRVADSRADQLKYRLGISDFLLASAAYDHSQMVMAAERLDKVPAEQRGWEWHYLKRLTHGGLFTLYGHVDAVSCVSFSPDGTRIVTGSDDRTAKVWDAMSGMPILELKGHSAGIRSVSFSPDATRIVTGSLDGTTKIWDARTGTRLLELNGHKADPSKGHTAEVSSVSFSPDGARIATGSYDATVRVSDARTGTLLLELKGDGRGVSGVSFSPDGARIAAGSYGTARVWDARTGKRLLLMQGHMDGPSEPHMCGASVMHWGGGRCLSFSPDGTRIVAGSDDKTAKVWDAWTGTLLLELKGHTSGVSGVSFSPDGTRIVTGSFDGTAKVWDAQTGTPLLELKGHESGVSGVAFSPDATRIVTCSEDRTAKVWDARTGTPSANLEGHTDEVRSVSFSTDGTRILTSDGTARVWDSQTRKLLLEVKDAGEQVSFSPDGTRIAQSEALAAKVVDARTGTPLLALKDAGHVLSVSYSPDGTRIATGNWDNTAMVWDARTGRRLLELKGHSWLVDSVSFSPDGTRILTGSSDRTAKVWDARTGAHLLTLSGGEANSVSFSPDGTRIVTSSGHVWAARTGTHLLDLEGYTQAVKSVSFSPDAKRIVTGSVDGTAKIWDARMGTLLLELKGHIDEVWSVSFSPDGTRIVTGSADQTAMIWDARTGTAPLELQGHTEIVRDVSYSPDGTRIVTGGDDRTVKAWDARTGRLQLDLEGHVGAVRSVSFSPDGARIAAGGTSGAKVWDARMGAPALELRNGGVECVSFSPDGSRIVTGNGETTGWVWDARTGSLLAELNGHSGYGQSLSFSQDGTRVIQTGGLAMMWDARTGHILKGEPLRPAPRLGQISPDGRWIAHTAGSRLELIPLQPDEGELAYRSFLMQPNIKRYREDYDAAIESGNDFAAKFYLKLLPPAEAIVRPLLARLLLRDDVLAALKAQPAADPVVHAACLKLVGAWSESASDCNDAGWDLVREPGRPESDYQQGLRLAKAACRLEQKNGDYLNTLGVAQYRCGLMAEALATLTRSNALNEEKAPSDLAFLALAQHRLGQPKNARETLERLRELMKDPKRSDVAVLQGFLREAETIELDRAFPADPFAALISIGTKTGARFLLTESPVIAGGKRGSNEYRRSHR